MQKSKTGELYLGDSVDRQQTFKHPEMVPLKLGVKLDPIQIALYYKCTPKDKQKRLYVVDLQNLLMLCEAQKITEALYQQHAAFFNRDKVPFEQVLKIIEKIIEFIHNEIMKDEEGLTDQDLDLQYM